jgi:hypothetical protein
MNRSVSKKRHIHETNVLLERRRLFEQTKPTSAQTSTQQYYSYARQLGYNEIGDGVERNPNAFTASSLPKINLPDGTYIGFGFDPHPMGKSIPHPEDNGPYNNHGNTFLILKPGGSKFPYGGETGYLVISNRSTNIDTTNDVITIKDGVAKSNIWGSDFYKILFKQ